MYIFVLILFCDASVWILWTPFTKGAALIHFTKFYKVHKVAQFNTQRSLLFLLQILNWGRNISSFLVSSFRDSSQGGPGTPEAHRLSPLTCCWSSLKEGGVANTEHWSRLHPSSALLLLKIEPRVKHTVLPSLWHAFPSCSKTKQVVRNIRDKINHPSAVSLLGECACIPAVHVLGRSAPASQRCS